MSETTAVTRMDATANIELFERQKKLAVDLAKSDLLPGNYRGKPANVLVALRRAATLELDPFFFMENTAVINGKLTMHSDGPLAVVRARAGSELAHFKEHWDEETKTATCEVQRRGQPMIVHTFSVADAETAGLFGRGDTWKKYPKRMCQMRARGYALRDGFADFLGGLQQAEALDEIVEPADFTESEKPSGADVLRSAMQKQSDEPEISDAEVVEQTPAEAAQEVVEACQRGLRRRGRRARARDGPRRLALCRRRAGERAGGEAERSRRRLPRRHAHEARHGGAAQGRAAGAFARRAARRGAAGDEGAPPELGRPRLRRPLQ
jgi:hypothetical protein